MTQIQTISNVIKKLMKCKMFQKLFTATLFKFCPLSSQQSTILDDSSQRPSLSQVKRLNFVIVMSAATQELPFKIISLMNYDGQSSTHEAAMTIYQIGSQILNSPPPKSQTETEKNPIIDDKNYN